MPIAQRMLAQTGLSVAEEGSAEAWSGFMYLMKKSAAIRAPFMSVTVNEPFLCSFYVNRVFGGCVEIVVLLDVSTKNIGTDPFSYWLKRCARM
jgi:hypothetical protein